MASNRDSTHLFHAKNQENKIAEPVLSVNETTTVSSVNISHQIPADEAGNGYSLDRGDTVRQPSDLGRPNLWQYTDEEFPSSLTTEEYHQFVGLELKNIIQAVVFIEDAYKYRSIDHKVDETCLRLYRRYHSTSVYITRYSVIFTLHILAFFEYPSSLSWTSDTRFRGDRVDIPCWLTHTIELVCLLLLLADIIIRLTFPMLARIHLLQFLIQLYLMGKYYFVRQKWDMGAIFLLIVSLIDWTVSAGMGCTEVVRVRRMLRPYFIIQNSSLMKKIVNCLRRTLPQVCSVLIMLTMHLFIFTLFGMLLFPKHQNSSDNSSDQNKTSSLPAHLGNSEGKRYFASLLDSFMSLLVLLTTSNNPDITMPAYSQSRISSLFFIIFLIIGLYCFMNMLTAVIYNQFRGYFQNSMQSSLNRRRLGVRAAFEVLQRKRETFPNDSSIFPFSSGVGGCVVKMVVEKTTLPVPMKSAIIEKLQTDLKTVHSAKDFQELFMELDRDTKPQKDVEVRWFQQPRLRQVQKVFVHHYFSYFGIFVAFCNVIVITVELVIQFDESFDNNNSDLRICNFAFAMYYTGEQLVKVWAMGWHRYVFDKGNVFDAIITLALVVGETFSAIKFGVPFFDQETGADSISTMWNVLRIINILIMVRLLRIIPHIKSMYIITDVLFDLVHNMKSFAGVLIVIYYAFAILGMEIFHDAITFVNATDRNRTFPCGTYGQLAYWANNFDDFAASLVVLWDVMVVNNWMVFLEAYREATNAWSYLFFVAWWLISVIIVMNLFTALIMENFIMKWDRNQQMRNSEEGLQQPVVLNSVHDMFRDLLKEPDDYELLVSLSSHRHLNLGR